MPFSRGENKVFCIKKTTPPPPKKQQKRNKEGLGPSEVAPQRKKTKKKEAQKKTAKIPKNSFSVISQIFPFFWVAFQNYPFLIPWPKKRASKKHYKNRGFRPFF